MDLQSAIEHQPEAGIASHATSQSRHVRAEQRAANEVAEHDGTEESSAVVEERAAKLAARQAAAAAASYRPPAKEDPEIASSLQEHQGDDEVSDTIRQISSPSSPNFRRRRRAESVDEGNAQAPQIDRAAIETLTSLSLHAEPTDEDANDTKAEAEESETADPSNEDASDAIAGENDEISGAEEDSEKAASSAVESPSDVDELAQERDADITMDESSSEDDDAGAAKDPTKTLLDAARNTSSASLATLRRSSSGRLSKEGLAHKERAFQREGSKESVLEEGEQEVFEEDDEPTLKYSRLRGSVPDILKKDSASALAVSDRFMALGTHGGGIFILDEQGNLTKGFRSHSASVLALSIDSTSEFVASAGMDGLVAVSSLSSSEAYTYDFKRVMRSISLEPGFGRRSTRAFICGGMAGQLVLREKSWFGHREQILHEGDGPIWTTQWRGNLVAWANDRGVRVIDVPSRRRVAFIAPPEDTPRADLFRCTLLWQDDDTLVMAWGDCIKLAKVSHRQDNGVAGGALLSNTGKASMEVTAILQLDCMISGIALRGPHFLVLAYISEDDYSDTSSVMDQREAQRRREGLRPELRLISRAGDELSSDVLSLQSFARFQCNDYLLVPSTDAILSAAAALDKGSKAGNKTGHATEQNLQDYFYVVSPKDIVIARSRDEKDHIDWLLEHTKYEQALAAVQKMGSSRAKSLGFEADEIGRRYLAFLIHQRKDWIKASEVAPGILGDNAEAWDDFILVAADQSALKSIIKAIPVDSPRLSTVTYDLILASFLRHDPSALLETMRSWPPEIYSTQAVILALEDRLQNTQQRGLKQMDSQLPVSAPSVRNVSDRAIMECLAEVFLLNRQPGRALPYYMRLRNPGVFALIRDHNLFTVVQDQALLLVEFEQDLLRQASKDSGDKTEAQRPAQSIQLLVEHIHSIPIHRVVPQLQPNAYFLFLYLDALFARDPQLISDFSDEQVALYAEFEPTKLLSYLRTMSSYYSFEKAYQICKSRDLVPEMVFLLSRIGDSKTALMLIIERIGDVERAISFVKEEKDPELWDDLVQYSEGKPAFIRGLLENVGGEVDAVKLIRRIKNGLEIEGLKDALIKILGGFSLQVSLLEGCASILESDGRALSLSLHQRQTQGLPCGSDTVCSSCGRALYDSSPETINNSSKDMSNTPTRQGDGAAAADFVIFLCGHAHHLQCLVQNPASLPKKPAIGDESSSEIGSADSDALVLNMTTTRAWATGQLHAAAVYGLQQRAALQRRHIQRKLRYAARLRVVLKRGCPLCHAEREQFSA